MRHLSKLGLYISEQFLRKLLGLGTFSCKLLGPGPTVSPRRKLIVTLGNLYFYFFRQLREYISLIIDIQIQPNNYLFRG